MGAEPINKRALWLCDRSDWRSWAYDAEARTQGRREERHERDVLAGGTLITLVVAATENGRLDGRLS
jgi:hypothetical protein